MVLSEDEFHEFVGDTSCWNDSEEKIQTKYTDRYSNSNDSSSVALSNFIRSSVSSRVSKKNDAISISSRKRKSMNFLKVVPDFRTFSTSETNGHLRKSQKLPMSVSYDGRLGRQTISRLNMSNSSNIYDMEAKMTSVYSNASSEYIKTYINPNYQSDYISSTYSDQEMISNSSNNSLDSSLRGSLLSFVDGCFPRNLIGYEYGENCAYPKPKPTRTLTKPKNVSDVKRRPVIPKICVHAAIFEADQANLE